MYNPSAPMKGVLVSMIDGVFTVLDTVSNILAPGQGIKNHTFSIRTSGAATGAIIIETAPTYDYIGEWSPLGGGPIDLATIAGGLAAGVLELQFSNIIINFVRVRITTVIAGAEVEVDYLGQ